MSFWSNKANWIKSAHNTKWCLIGCAIGDMGTIGYFQIVEHSFAIWQVMALAIVNGLLTSILLETVILIKGGFKFSEALKTAMGMSFISMLAMEISMNLMDYLVTGGAQLTWQVVPLMLLIGFLTPWPYNYWRLEKFNKSCCQ